MNVTGLATHGVEGLTVKSAVSGRGLIATSSNAFAVAALWSVTFRVTLYVPFTANEVAKLDAVPDAGLPPVTAHAYVYGAVPPLTTAL